MFESVQVTALGVSELLDHAADLQRQQARLEARRQVALAEYAGLHTTVPESLVPGAARLVRLGGEGAPAVDEFCVDEFAATARLQPGSARGQLAVALDLVHRLPRVLAALAAGRIAGWRARLVADATRHLTLAQVALAQQRILPVLAGLGGRRLAEIVAQVVIDTDPAGAQAAADAAKERRHVTLDPTDPSDAHGLVSGAFCADPGDARRFDASVDRVADWLGLLGDTDPKRIRRAKALGVLANPHAALDLMRRATGQTVAPHSGGGGGGGTTAGAGGTAEAGGPWPEATLYVHLTYQQWTQTRTGAASLEGVGPVTITQATDLLGHAKVKIQPVIDLNNMPTSDDRFARGRLRDAVVLKNPVCIFPYCSRHSRTNQADHTIPVPHGKTAIDNLAPPCTGHHRAKTHAGWQLQQPFNGIYLWKSPHGRIYLIDHRGVTHDLGRPGS